MKKSQNQKIAEYLCKGKSITPLEALNRFGCFRLSARIYDLDKIGFNIKPITTQTKTSHFSEYFIPKRSINKAKKLLLLFKPQKVSKQKLLK